MCVDLCGAAPGMMSCQEQAQDPLLCLHVSCYLCAQLSFHLSAQPRLAHLSHPWSLSCLNGPHVRASGGAGHNPASFPDPLSDCWRSGQSTKMEMGGHPARQWPGANAVLACLLPPAGGGKADGPSSAEDTHTDGGPPEVVLCWACSWPKQEGRDSREVTSSEAGGRQVDAGRAICRIRSSPQ